MRYEPTERQRQALAHALLFGRKEAAKRMGIGDKTLANHLWELYVRLGVENLREAAIVLGWLDIPAKYITDGVQPLPEVRIEHHPLAEQLLNYADAILEGLSDASPKAKWEAPASEPFKPPAGGRGRPVGSPLGK